MVAKIDAATLVAYLDGELGHAAALRVEAALAGDPQLQRHLDALKQVDQVLDDAFQPVLATPLPPLALTDRPPLAVAASAAGSRHAVRLAWAAGLAGLFIGFAGGQLGPALLAPAEPPVVAAIQAKLPEVLETQLSGTTVAFSDPVNGISGTVKPLTTFVNADGRYCRAFEAHVAEDDTSLSSRGVACRDSEGRWVTRVQVNAV